MTSGEATIRVIRVGALLGLLGAATFVLAAATGSYYLSPSASLLTMQTGGYEHLLGTVSGALFVLGGVLVVLVLSLRLALKPTSPLVAVAQASASLVWLLTWGGVVMTEIEEGRAFGSSYWVANLGLCLVGIGGVLVGWGHLRSRIVDEAGAELD